MHYGICEMGDTTLSRWGKHHFCCHHLHTAYDYFYIEAETAWVPFCKWRSPWWHHQMGTFSALLTICAGNSPVPGEFPTQRPVTRSFGVFFDLRLNKRLSKQPWGWWFETQSLSLWRHCNGLFLYRGRNSMGAILHATLSINFPCMKSIIFWLKFDQYLFARIQKTILQHWFRELLDAKQATRHVCSEPMMP